MRYILCDFKLHRCMGVTRQETRAGFAPVIYQSLSVHWGLIIFLLFFHQFFEELSADNKQAQEEEAAKEREKEQQQQQVG